MTDIEEGKLYLCTVRSEKEFGYFITINESGSSGLMPRSNITDRYLANHTGLYSVGDTCVAIVEKADHEKKRYTVSAKESHIRDAGIPEWLGNKEVFDLFLTELKQTISMFDVKLEFGQKVDVNFEVKAACTRDNVEDVEVKNIELPKRLSAVCVGPRMQEITEDTKSVYFIGFHKAGILLFVDVPEFHETKVTVRNSFQ